jgi:hypothetical protein
MNIDSMWGHNDGYWPYIIKFSCTDDELPMKFGEILWDFLKVCYTDDFQETVDEMFCKENCELVDAINFLQQRDILEHFDEYDYLCGYLCLLKDNDGIFDKLIRNGLPIGADDRYSPNKIIYK